MFLIFVSALAVGFSGAMMPGSLLTYTIRQALTAGPKAGFIITLGHALLELALIILIFLGFNMVLKSEAAQFAIGMLGGALLMYMGVDMIAKAAKNKVSVKADEKGSSSKGMFLSGIVISAANPYFLLWWAVVGLGFVMQSYQEMGYIGVGIFYIGHILADFIWYGAISIIIGKTRKFIKEKPYRVIIVILGAALVFFGCRFVYGAIAGLV